MTERNIFRKKPLQKMTSPDDLDEMLQVNSSQTWLMFGAIFFVLTGLITWIFMGSITQNVNGLGIIKVQELPRVIISNNSGQVDAIYCKTGDQVEPGQKLIKIATMDGQSYTNLSSPYKGEITGLIVNEGDYIQAGEPILQIIRSSNNQAAIPEVIFFVPEHEVLQLKNGMIAFLKIGNTAIPPDLLNYRINFISKYPASRAFIQNIFENQQYSLLKTDSQFEVRASLISDMSTLSTSKKEALLMANGLSCQVIVPVSKQTPATFFSIISK